MTTQTDVSLDFGVAPRIDWGVPDSQHDPVRFTLTLRGLEIPCTIFGPDTLRKSEIRSQLQRHLKFFVCDGELRPAIQYKKTVKLTMANYTDVSVNTWADRVRDDFDPASHFNVWFNIARPHEVLVMDKQHRTSIVTNQPGLLVGKPTVLEFIRAEGGILFNRHQLGLDGRTHQAEPGMKIRRDMARRTRGGTHYGTFGILDLREENGLVELWVGEDHLWSVDPINRQRGLLVNTEHFTDWDVAYAVGDWSTNARIAEFTLNQYDLTVATPE